MTKKRKPPMLNSAEEVDKLLEDPKAFEQWFNEMARQEVEQYGHSPFAPSKDDEA